MTPAAELATQWWTVPPARKVSYLTGVDAELLGIALDPLPATAPAVVRFRPATGGPLGDQVAILLDELDRAAVALFPRWLPGAERLDGPQGLGVPAVRALAARTARRSANFGPFLVDLAERGLRGQTGAQIGRAAHFPAEVRAAGLARAIADAYRRESVALLIEVPADLPPADERALTSGAEWLAQHGRLTIWLAGAGPNVVDRIRSVAITLPAYLNQLVVEAEAVEPATEPSNEPILWYPPLSGAPRCDSAAEQALERALQPYEWALGRRWNHVYEWHVLGRPYRLDLFWPDEGLVVEVDGPEHRGRLKFADDRRRDVQLQLLGYDVFRFTNEDVLSDVQATVLKIRQLLGEHRAMRQHVDH
jgi:very-short-patch-repair endonuclease